MKILTILQVMFVSFPLVMNSYASLSPSEENHSRAVSPYSQEMDQATNIQSQLLTMQVPSTEEPQINQLSNRRRNYIPFLKSLGITENIDKAVESCKFLENMLSDDDLAQADMEAASPNAALKKGMYDWVTSGWGLAQWIVGTSRNFSYLTIVACAAFANVFPQSAVSLATASGMAAGFGAFLPKTHQYCKEKKLKRMAYNMIVMSGQLERRARTLHFEKEPELNAQSASSSAEMMEEGMSNSSESSPASSSSDSEEG